MTKSYTLYHGTTKESAAELCRDGWRPNARSAGGQCGDPRYLYLTNHPENALWYSQQKGDDAVVEINVPEHMLRVDPDDGSGDTVAEELGGSIPGSVVLIADMPASAFQRHETIPSIKVHEVVKQLHSRPQDLDQGDLLNRVARFTAYVKRSLPIESLNLDEFILHDHLVDEYEATYRKTGTYPPIVYDGIDGSIIDGLHRANALARCGVKEIDALVGVAVYCHPYWRPEDCDDEGMDDDKPCYSVPLSM